MFFLFLFYMAFPFAFAFAYIKRLQCAAPFLLVQPEMKTCTSILGQVLHNSQRYGD